MIPASYLFKDIYNQHWVDADPQVNPGAEKPTGLFNDGLMSPIVAVGQRLRPTRRAAHLGSHAHR